jgi:nicotinate-nucleotide adenylyltransferase
MRLALFGGSFNPPHVAHQMAALWVLETGQADELWLVPCFRHPFAKDLAPFADRFEMCRLAAAPLGPRATVSRVEAELGGESLTLRTLREVAARRPGDELALVVGADILGEWDRWYGHEEIERAARRLVVGRQGFAGGAPIELPAIRSTDIRARLGRGDDVAALVPAAVLAYVRRRGLYGAR